MNTNKYGWLALACFVFTVGIVVLACTCGGKDPQVAKYENLQVGQPFDLSMEACAVERTPDYDKYAVPRLSGYSVFRGRAFVTVKHGIIASVWYER